MQCRNCLQELPAAAALCHHCGAVQMLSDSPVTTSRGTAQVNTTTDIRQASQLASGSVRATFPSPLPIKRPPPSDRASIHYPQTTADRSSGLIAGVLGLLVLGASCSYSLPALSFGEFGSVSFLEIKRYYDDSWLWWLAHIGVIGAAIAAASFTTDQLREQAWCITGGSALTLPYVFNLVSLLDEFGVPVSLGSGTWLAMLCFLGAAALPWIILKRG